MKNSICNKCIMMICIVAMAMIMTSGTCAFAETKHLQVNIVSGEFELNGRKIDNDYRKYPLIRYNEIVYLPLTYEDSRFLGIETTWSNEDGIGIFWTGVSSIYKQNQIIKKNRTGYNRKYDAQVAGFPVHLNGKIIENNKADYPIIVFRNVTYLPLTWEIAVEELKLDYQGVHIAGIEKINSKQPKIEQIEIEGLMGVWETDNNNKIADLLLKDDYLYFVKNEGNTQILYKQLLSDNQLIDEPINIYKIHEKFNNEDYLPRTGLFKKDEKYYFRYHLGGGFMGSDHVYKLDESDNIKKIRSGGYFDFVEYENEPITVGYGGQMHQNNLSILANESKELSKKDLMYGCYIDANGGYGPQSGSQYKGESNLRILDGYLYIVASSFENRTNRLYKIKIDDLTYSEVNDIETTNFQISKNYMYQKEDVTNLLYKQSIEKDRKRPIQLSKQPADQFVVLSDNVYFINKDTKEIVKIDLSGKESVVMPGFTASNIQEDGGYVIGTSNIDEKYGFIVIDDDGKIILKSNQVPRNIQVDSDKLIYEAEYNELFTVKLR